MGLLRFKPIPSGRMGTLWTLSTIKNAALVEFGCMGHMLYSGVTLKHGGVNDLCRLYSTHIDETDIALGGTERLEHTVANIIKNDSPKVIFFLPSAVPEVIGTDLRALCDELQQEHPEVMMIPFGHGGFNVNQHDGVKNALLTLVKNIPAEVGKTPEPTFNIIGSCADLFRFQADAAETIRAVEGAFGIKPLCVLTSGTCIEDIERMGGAHVNLVIRREGEAAAKYLQRKYGTPYILHRPYGIDGTAEWLEEIERVLGSAFDRAFVEKERGIARSMLEPVMPRFRHMSRSHMEEVTLHLGAHADIVEGILSFGCREMGFNKGVCWCDSPDMGTDELPYYSEEKWIPAVEGLKDGLFMSSGEILEWAGRSLSMQISYPDRSWHLHPFEPPFMGFRGAVNLVNLWINCNIERW
ncbi:nitrogenase component 1 [Seleniivibrio woodruffii]|uniref:nitrogenase component 1 n=1 Tax=Seleniivibrio woodruffii TaxID=1078050 RepID=UPI0026EAE608|nr:nitrogenase component 1 [Seleniivibrio woodruffii]